MERKLLAIIPARGKSKGIKKKNLYPINGVPLIDFTITAARDSEVFTDIVVSTDCPDISLYCSKAGVRVIDRPKEISGDFAKSEDAISHTLLELQSYHQYFDDFILLQPTSPLRTANDIKAALLIYKSSHADSLVSVCEAEHPFQKGLIETSDGIKPITTWQDLSSPRQELQKSFRINGAIYIRSVKEFLQTHSLYSPTLKVFKMSRDTSLDIDSLSDVARLEIFLEQKRLS
ncbi:hypothetical protein BTA51_00495 [Hahella sp. CCB-MM4]|uniref:acylneuraminate cytidylyltransferase family protein n=1 Tax=Hahella sp. (strain CCB-MM4) TaxID=1926491 RepID=UPI000B9C6212|nr:acylneuraminate cytidylyltransferase family protein [Hahella sp. CCB-MM4]OZG74918.1 hypothetical protein BTA51_00495 [Hahella sp. CCB-MM4]